MDQRLVLLFCDDDDQYQTSGGGSGSFWNRWQPQWWEDDAWQQADPVTTGYSPGQLVMMVM